ncbi:ester cyclase [Rhizobium sp. SSA_523]|uniref:nuclear transport factor 2 family protein n=1 Tax=Rhizobium sp. SSA_523 TaxID=2952477 RepID=UPI0020918874|nr:ester cyclase [Rhizobium sp. SSA_523]MCO5733355.1 ester cyclase [Rhizobium sp. SSA_523]WKC21666.1 ester cyclase [Rhizobium sp. SSA_523]
MKPFWNRWDDFPDYILGITKEIWEDRGLATLEHYYSSDIPVRTPMGVARGNKGVIASTMATLNEFPDRELLGEDVIWSGNDETGFLSSHRIISTGTHTGDGYFGKATGKGFTVRVIADCAAKAGTIFDEWLVRDNGGLVRQLGEDPQAFARSLIMREGGPEKASRPFTPETDIAGDYTARGNDDPWGERYAETLKRIMKADLAHALCTYDRAAIGEMAGGRSLLGARKLADFWLALRSSFPSADFKIHHRIGMQSEMMPPRAAIRWSLDGTHDGWGMFGSPTGARVHVMGMSHVEYGPFGPDGIGLRREFTLFDEVAIWKQILLKTGDL